MLRAVKVRLYPNQQQTEKLSQITGSCRWWWNYALNLCNQTYQQTGKGLGRNALNQVLPPLKKAEETVWLSEIDLGIKYFAIIASENRVSKYANHRHLKKHERNLARKQQKLARKQKGSKRKTKRGTQACFEARADEVGSSPLHEVKR